MNALKSIVDWLTDGYWPTAEEQADLPLLFKDAGQRYTPRQFLAAGDEADLHLATAGGEEFLLKAARETAANAGLETERRTLMRLLRSARGTTYRHYLPHLVESFVLTDPCPRRVNVFRYQPELRTLEEVHEQQPALDGRHLAWIFKRLLTVLGFCQQAHLVHGAVLPCHVLLDVSGHGLQLIGWSHSTSAGRRLSGMREEYTAAVGVPPSGGWGVASDQERPSPPKGGTPTAADYRGWYPVEVQRRQPVGPATDLFLAARCVLYLAGGDPLTNRWSDHVPLQMQRFLNTCLLESARMRPDDAWALQDDFDRLLQGLYGPPKFHPLSLT